MGQNHNIKVANKSFKNVTKPQILGIDGNKSILDA
jgi:hypothetical protein